MPGAAQAQEEEAERPWTVAVSGGATVFAGEGDQPFVEISVSRELGSSWIQLSAAQVESGGDAVSAGFVPATTRQVALAGGTAFGAVSLDAYAALGDRRFDSQEFARRDGRSVRVDSDGSSFGIGASATYDIAVGASAFVSPSLALDYAELDVARVATLPGGELFTIKEQEDGVTATASLAYQHLFGADYAHNVGGYAGLVHSSNNAVYNPGNSPEALASLFAFRATPGVTDSWAEVGASGSFGLSPALRLNLVAIRTLGFAGPEATSFAAGISRSF